MQKKLHKTMKNGKIAIVSPAGAVEEKYIDGATTQLALWGFEAIVTPHARGQYGRYSATAQERINDLQWAINQEDIMAILCARGGYGAIQIVDKIDFSPLKKYPKYFIGFSDITVFHNVLTNLKIPSVHGIMAKHLTENAPNEMSVEMLHHILLGQKPLHRIPPHELNRNGTAKGILTGGNLSVLYGLRGTKYDIKPRGKILFLEDLSEKPYHIDRMMTNLKLGGILENLSALIIGQFTDFEEDESMLKSIYDIIFDAVSDYNFPVCFNFPAGHVKNNLPLIFGEKYQFIINEKEVLLIPFF